MRAVRILGLVSLLAGCGRRDAVVARDSARPAPPPQPVTEVQEVAETPRPRCALPPGGLRISADTVAGFPTTLSIAELDQRCHSDSVDDYGMGGYTARARIYSFDGGVIAAVQSQNESALHYAETADLWSAEGDSLRLPDGRLMPATVGALRAAYPHGLISSDKSDDSDGVLAFVCDFPRLTFPLGYDTPTPADTGHWPFSAHTVPDSTRVSQIQVWPENWWHTTATICAQAPPPDGHD